MSPSPSALLLAFGSLAAAAFVKDPLLVNPAAQKDSSWSPARETSAAEVEARAAEQWSPRPTDGPDLDFMQLFPRLDGYTLPKGTCGFVSSDELAYGCINTAATCTYSDDYIGCCEPNKDCSRVQTTCINSAQAAGGACNLPKDFHTLCCTASTLGQCWTWLFSTTTGGSTGLYSFLDCSSKQGTGTLLAYDPTWSRTHVPSSTTSSSSAKSSDSTKTSTASTATSTGGGGSSTNVGAIAGGAVGGVAALALVGVAAFLLIRRRKKGGKSSEPKGSPPAPSTAHPSTTMSPPPPTMTPSSPGNTTIYPSGVPTNFTGYSPSPGAYDQMSQMSPQSTAAYPMYPNQQPYAPPQQPPQYPPQYPPQQQQQLYPQNAYGYQPQNSPSPGAPSPGAPSPSAIGTPPAVPPPQHQQQHHATELPTVNPVGMESNRAELQ